MLNTLHRYAAAPPFGVSGYGIRRFTNNVSEMKKLAARDFEDLLQVNRNLLLTILLLTHFQCSIPCFMGLFQDAHNKPISALLYVILTWHGLAKLRLHTELTLTLLRTATIRLGHEMRVFQKDICPNYDTKETSKEAEGRVCTAARRVGAAKASSNAQEVPAGTLPSTSEDPTTAPATAAKIGKVPGARQPYTFKLTKPKFHFIGDYAPDIESSGTTDNYSTQTVRRI